MLSTSLDFRRRMAENSRILFKATLTLANGTVRELVGDDFMLASPTFNEGTSSSGSFDIGAAIMGSCSITLNNMDGRFDSYDFTDSILVPYVGCEIDDEHTEWLLKGYYGIDQPESYGGTIGLDGLDNMRLLEKPFSGVTLVWPATMGAIANAICAHCGIVLLNPAFEGYNIVVETAPDNASLNCLSMISYIAQATGHWAKCDNRGRLVFGWYDTDAYEDEDWLDGDRFDDATPYASGDDAEGGAFMIGGDTYEGGEFGLRRYIQLYSLADLTVNTDDVVITGVRVIAQDGEEQDETDDESLYGSEGYVLELSGNPLIQYGMAEYVAEHVGLRVVGMRFRPFDLSSQGDPALEAGDPVIITDRLQRQYRSYVTRVTWKAGSYMAVACAAESPGRNRADSFAAVTRAIVELRNRVRDERTEREVAIDNLQQALDTASGFYSTREVQPDGSTIYYMHDKSTLAASQIVWKVTSEAIGISTNGGLTYPVGVDATGTAILNKIYTIGLDATYITTGALTVRNPNTQAVVFQADADTGAVYLSDVSGNYWDLHNGRWQMLTNGTIGGRNVGDLIDEVDDSVTDVDVEYAQNQSNVTAPTDASAWSTTPPTWREGYYIWQRTKKITNGNQVSYSQPVCISGRDGRTGTNAASIYLYQRASTAPASGPTANLTYTFADATLTPASALGSWSRSIPDGADDCFVTIATAVSNAASDTITPNQWSTPIKLAQGGTDGMNHAFIYLHKRAAAWDVKGRGTKLTAPDTASFSVTGTTATIDGTVTGTTLRLGSGAPATPSSALTYTFSTASFSGGSLDGWTQGVPTGTEPVWVTTAVAIAATSTDVIQPNEWAEPVILAQSGESSVVETLVYATSSSGAEAPTDGWQAEPPEVAQGMWMWIRTIYTDGSTSDSCSYVGTDGQDGKSVYFKGTSKEDGVTTIEIVDQNGNLHTLEIEDGTDGPTGRAGDNAYVHIAWCNTPDNSDGSFTTTQQAGVDYKYVGIYTDSTETDSTTFGDYTWSLIKGADGRGIADTQVRYGTSASADVQPTSWASSPPSSIDQGTWMWVRTVFTYTDGTTTTQYNKNYIGTDGKDGLSVYVGDVSKSGGVTTVTIVTHDAETGTDTESTLTIADGHDGPMGTAGANGYTHFAWANSADGTTDFSTTESANKRYMGVYADHTASDSTNPADYSWTLVKGADGAPGTNGYSTATVYLYQRKASVPLRPSNTLTYTFATHTLSGTIDNGWSTTIPNGTDPCYVIAATATGTEATDTIASSEWSSPVVLARDGATGPTGATGASGLNQATIYLYKRGSEWAVDGTKLIAPDSTVFSVRGTKAKIGGTVTGTTLRLASGLPVPPSSSLTYTFESGELSGSLGGWSRTVPNTDGNPCWVTSAVAISSDATDVIEPGNWAAPTRIVVDGMGFKSLEEQYYLSTSKETPTGGSWITSEQPEWIEGRYVWTRSKITWDDGSVTYTDPVLAGAINSANENAAAATSATDNLICYNPNPMRLVDVAYNDRPHYGPTLVANEGNVVSGGVSYVTLKTASRVNPFCPYMPTFVQPGDIVRFEGVVGNTGIVQATLTLRVWLFTDTGTSPSVTYYSSSEVLTAHEWKQLAIEVPIPAGDDLSAYTRCVVGLYDGSSSSTDICVTSTARCWVPSAMEQEARALDRSLGSEEVFNRLTENGTKQGMVWDPDTGDIYFNATYIRTGTLDASLIKTGKLEVKKNGATVFSADCDTGTVEISADVVKIGNSTMTSTVAGMKATYATCTTAAGTVEKAATCQDFTLYTGAQVVVRFTKANTAASPTLNVNGTGAKPIYLNGAALPADAYWSAGQTVAFVYDGTNWAVQGGSTEALAITNKNNYATLSQNVNGISTTVGNHTESITQLQATYATCTTAAGTAAKVATCSGFSLRTGAVVVVKFTKANTAATPTLNVNNTGAKAINIKGTAIDSAHYWKAGDSLTFVYDGSAWEVTDSAILTQLDVTNTNVSTITQTANQIATNVTAIQAAWATCSTASSATAKSVSIAGFRPYVGKTVSVRFNYANTASNPTLRVYDSNDSSNSASGPIYVNGTNMDEDHWWKASQVLTLVWTGSAWEVSDGVLVSQIDTVYDFASSIDQRADSITATVTGVQASYGTCSTSSSTTQKEVAIAGFRPYVGKTVTVRFGNGNTAYSPTLYVYDPNDSSKYASGSMTINGSSLGSDEDYRWSAGDVITFVWTGSAWAIGDGKTMSQIKQTIRSIELRVSNASLGQNASIILDVDGSTQSKTLNLTNVRNAFANDESTITISAGRVTFNSGTFVVNSTYFNVTSTGVITATSGTIGCMNVSQNSLSVSTGSISFSSDTFSLSSTYFSVSRTGVISASSGTIGGFTITGSSLYYNRSSHSSLSSGVYMNSDGISTGDGSHYIAVTDGAIKGGRSSGSTTGYMVCDEYFTYNGRYGVRIAGNGGVAIYGDQVGFGSWTSYGTSGYIDVGRSKSLYAVTGVTVSYNGRPSLSISQYNDWDTININRSICFPISINSDGTVSEWMNPIYVGRLVQNLSIGSIDYSLTLPGIDCSTNTSYLNFSKGLMTSS